MRKMTNKEFVECLRKPLKDLVRLKLEEIAIIEANLDKTLLLFSSNQTLTGK